MENQYNSMDEEDTDLCSICLSGDVFENNEILYCDKCDVAVHQVCYSVESIPEGEWYCDPCSANLSPLTLPCVLCSTKGGAYKRTDNPGQWAHSLCYRWIPEAYESFPVSEPRGIVNLRLLDKKRLKLKCSLCNSKNGACVQCAYGRCSTSMHPWCAIVGIPKRKEGEEQIKQKNSFNLSDYEPSGCTNRIIKNEETGHNMWEIFCKTHCKGVSESSKKTKGHHLSSKVNYDDDYDDELDYEEEEEDFDYDSSYYASKKSQGKNKKNKNLKKKSDKINLSSSANSASKEQESAPISIPFTSIQARLTESSRLNRLSSYFNSKSLYKGGVSIDIVKDFLNYNVNINHFLHLLDTLPISEWKNYDLTPYLIEMKEKKNHPLYFTVSQRSLMNVENKNNEDSNNLTALETINSPITIPSSSSSTTTSSSSSFPLLSLLEWPGFSDGEAMDLDHFWNYIGSYYPEDHSKEWLNFMLEDCIPSLPNLTEYPRELDQNLRTNLENYADELVASLGNDKEKDKMIYIERHEEILSALSMSSANLAEFLKKQQGINEEFNELFFLNNNDYFNQKKSSKNDEINIELNEDKKNQRKSSVFSLVLGEIPSNSVIEFVIKKNVYNDINDNDVSHISPIKTLSSSSSTTVEIDSNSQISSKNLTEAEYVSQLIHKHPYAPLETSVLHPVPVLNSLTEIDSSSSSSSHTSYILTEEAYNELMEKFSQPPINIEGLTSSEKNYHNLAKKLMKCSIIFEQNTSKIRIKAENLLNPNEGSENEKASINNVSSPLAYYIQPPNSNGINTLQFLLSAANRFILVTLDVVMPYDINEYVLPSHYNHPFSQYSREFASNYTNKKVHPVVNFSDTQSKWMLINFSMAANNKLLWANSYIYPKIMNESPSSEVLFAAVRVSSFSILPQTMKTFKFNYFDVESRKAEDELDRLIAMDTLALKHFYSLSNEIIQTALSTPLPLNQLSNNLQKKQIEILYNNINNINKEKFLTIKDLSSKSSLLTSKSPSLSSLLTVSYLNLHIQSTILINILNGIKDQHPNISYHHHYVQDQEAVPASWTLSVEGRENVVEEKEKEKEEQHDDSICHVCFDGVFSEENSILFCDGCNSAFHLLCYGIKSVPEDDFYCDRCSFLKDFFSDISEHEFENNWSNQAIASIASCALCPMTHGAMKPTYCGRWVHAACAILCQGVVIHDLETMSPIDISHVPLQLNSTFFDSYPLINTIKKDHGSITNPFSTTTSICMYCQSSNGFLASCCYSNSDSSCSRKFHPLCAWYEGNFIEAIKSDPNLKNCLSGASITFLCTEHDKEIRGKQDYHLKDIEYHKNIEKSLKLLNENYKQVDDDFVWWNVETQKKLRLKYRLKFDDLIKVQGKKKKKTKLSKLPSSSTSSIISSFPPSGTHHKPPKSQQIFSSPSIPIASSIIPTESTRLYSKNSTATHPCLCGICFNTVLSNPWGNKPEISEHYDSNFMLTTHNLCLPCYEPLVNLFNASSSPWDKNYNYNAYLELAKSLSESSTPLNSVSPVVSTPSIQEPITSTSQIPLSSAASTTQNPLPPTESVEKEDSLSPITSPNLSNTPNISTPLNLDSNISLLPQNVNVPSNPLTQLEFTSSSIENISIKKSLPYPPLAYCVSCSVIVHTSCLLQDQPNALSELLEVQIERNDQNFTALAFSCEACLLPSKINDLFNLSLASNANIPPEISEFSSHQSQLASQDQNNTSNSLGLPIKIETQTQIPDSEQLKNEEIEKKSLSTTTKSAPCCYLCFRHGGYLRRVFTSHDTLEFHWVHLFCVNMSVYSLKVFPPSSPLDKISNITSDHLLTQEENMKINLIKSSFNKIELKIILRKQHKVCIICERKGGFLLSCMHTASFEGEEEISECKLFVHPICANLTKKAFANIRNNVHTVFCTQHMEYYVDCVQPSTDDLHYLSSFPLSVHESLHKQADLIYTFENQKNEEVKAEEDRMDIVNISNDSSLLSNKLSTSLIKFLYPGLPYLSYPSPQALRVSLDKLRVLSHLTLKREKLKKSIHATRTQCFDESFTYKLKKILMKNDSFSADSVSSSSNFLKLAEKDDILKDIVTIYNNLDIEIEEDAIISDTDDELDYNIIFNPNLTSTSTAATISTATAANISVPATSLPIPSQIPSTEKIKQGQQQLITQQLQQSAEKHLISHQSTIFLNSDIFNFQFVGDFDGELKKIYIEANQNMNQFLFLISHKLKELLKPSFLKDFATHKFSDSTSSTQSLTSATSAKPASTLKPNALTRFLTIGPSTTTSSTANTSSSHKEFNPNTDSVHLASSQVYFFSGIDTRSSVIETQSSDKSITQYYYPIPFSFTNYSSIVDAKINQLRSNNPTYEVDLDETFSNSLIEHLTKFVEADPENFHKLYKKHTKGPRPADDLYWFNHYTGGDNEGIPHPESVIESKKRPFKLSKKDEEGIPHEKVEKKKKISKYYIPGDLEHFRYNTAYRDVLLTLDKKDINSTISSFDDIIDNMKSSFPTFSLDPISSDILPFKRKQNGNQVLDESENDIKKIKIENKFLNDEDINFPIVLPELLHYSFDLSTLPYLENYLQFLLQYISDMALIEHNSNQNSSYFTSLIDSSNKRLYLSNSTNLISDIQVPSLTCSQPKDEKNSHIKHDECISLMADFEEIPPSLTNYNEQVRRPITLTSIENKIKSRSYHTLSSFVYDIILMLNNGRRITEGTNNDTKACASILVSVLLEGFFSRRILREPLKMIPKSSSKLSLKKKSPNKTILLCNLCHTHYEVSPWPSEFTIEYVENEEKKLIENQKNKKNEERDTIKCSKYGWLCSSCLLVNYKALINKKVFIWWHDDKAGYQGRITHAYNYQPIYDSATNTTSDIELPNSILSSSTSSSIIHRILYSDNDWEAIPLTCDPFFIEL